MEKSNTVFMKYTPVHNLPSESRRLLNHLGPNGFIAGGGARWVLEPFDSPPPADWDVFCYSQNDFDLLDDRLAKLGYVQQECNEFGSIKYAPSERIGHLPVHLVNPYQGMDERPNYGMPEAVIARFALTVEQAAIWLANKSNYIVQGLMSYEGYIHNKERRIFFTGHGDPVRLLRRVCKYAAKGYKLSEPEAIRLLNAWSDLEESKRKALQQELTEATY